MVKKKAPPLLQNVSQLAGQGVDGLFTQSAEGDIETRLPLEKLVHWEKQPRMYFSAKGLKQLAASLKKRGGNDLPVLVRPKRDVFEVIAGERRYRAAQIAELPDLKVIVRKMTDEEALEAALSENLDREDLNPVEELESLLNLLALRLQEEPERVPACLYQMKHVWEKKKDENGENVLPIPEAPQQQLVRVTFEQFGYDWYTFTCNQLKLRHLPSDIYEAIASGQIEYTKGLKLKTVKNDRQRQELLQEAIEGNWSLNQIKKKIQELKSQSQSRETPQQKLSSLTSRLKKATLWKKEPKIWKKIETQLKKIESLLEEKIL